MLKILSKNIMENLYEKSKKINLLQKLESRINRLQNKQTACRKSVDYSSNMR